MEIEVLKLFLSVASTGSFSRAAGLARVTQSTMSKRIFALEVLMGHRLFERDGRGARLTEAGRLLVGHAESLVGAAENLHTVLRAEFSQPQGMVHVALQASIAWPLVHQMHVLLRRDFPLVRLRVSEAPTRRIVEMIQDAYIDVGILSQWGQDDLPQAEPLFTSGLMLVAPNGDALTRRRCTLPFARLRGLPLILPPMPNGVRVSLEETARHAGIEFQVVMETQSAHLIKKLVREGLGYGVGFLASFREELEREELSAASIVDPVLTQQFYMALPSHRRTTGATSAVAALIRKLCGSGAGAISPVGTVPPAKRTRKARAAPSQATGRKP